MRSARAIHRKKPTQVLDRIGADIAGMIIRPDVDQLYKQDQTGNDEMFFYSQTPGYFGANGSTVSATQQSPTSLIGYRISTSANPTLPPKLERIVQGMTWSNQPNGSNPQTSLPFLTFPASTAVNLSPPPATGGTIPLEWPLVVSDPDTNPDASTSFWHTVGPQVFRIEICYQLRNGTFTLTPPNPSQPPALSTNSPPTPVAGNINDTTGIVVAIALLDTKSRQLVPANSWSGLINALKDPTSGNLTSSSPQLMNTTWNTALQTAGFAQNVGIPQIAAGQIAVYQRYYPLNAPIAK